MGSTNSANFGLTTFGLVQYISDGGNSGTFESLTGSKGQIPFSQGAGLPATFGFLTFVTNDFAVTTTTTPIGQISIVGGTGITTSGTTAHTVTINAAGGGLKWSEESGNFTAAVNNGYFCSAALTAMLPASPAIGDTVVIVSGTPTMNRVTIVANSGQQIRMGDIISTAGTAINSQIGDSITLAYRASTSTWFVVASEGCWTIA